MSYVKKMDGGMTVVGIAARVSNSEVEKIQALWEEFSSSRLAERISGIKDGTVYSVYFEYAGDLTQPYSLLVGFAVDADAEVPEGMRKVTVAEGEYAVFDGSGQIPVSVMRAWSCVWETPLERLYTTDFERYGVDGSVKIHVGIR